MKDTKAERRLIAAAKEDRALIKELNQRKVERNWDMGQARTCLTCGEVLLTKKYLRIHRANHKATETKCVKTATT